MSDVAKRGLPEFTSWQDERAQLSAWVLEHGRTLGRLDILEAGCGLAWHLELDDLPFHLTGVDSDAAALAQRKAAGDLDEAVLGDLRTVEFEPGSFDVVYNSFVLEHIEGAEQVLDHFVSWTRPGGILVLRFPDRDSSFGFVTRMSPHWFHVLYKRWIQGDPDAGKPGHAPFPTSYDPVVSLGGFRDHCRRRGLEIVEEWSYPVEAQSSRFAMQVVAKAARVLGALSFGRLEGGRAWLTYVVRVPAAPG